MNSCRKKVASFTCRVGLGGNQIGFDGGLRGESLSCKAGVDGKCAGTAPENQQSPDQNGAVPQNGSRTEWGSRVLAETAACHRHMPGQDRDNGRGEDDKQNGKDKSRGPRPQSDQQKDSAKELSPWDGERNENDYLVG